MSVMGSDHKLEVVFFDSWSQISHKRMENRWFVPSCQHSASARMFVVYANLLGRKDLLKCPHTGTMNELIQELNAGLPVSSVDRVKDLIGINRSAVSQILQISSRTLSRRSKLRQDVSERVLRIGTLFQRALEVLGSRERAEKWFRSPKKALGNQTPLEFAETELGSREVEDLLGRLEHGVYS